MKKSLKTNRKKLKPSRHLLFTREKAVRRWDLATRLEHRRIKSRRKGRNN